LIVGVTPAAKLARRAVATISHGGSLMI